MQLELDLRWQKVFDQLFVDLKTASDAVNWEAVRDIDAKIARALTEVNKAVSLSDELATKKSQLKALHGTVLTSCRGAFEAARIELLQQLQYAEARNAYMHTEMYSQNLP